MGPARAATEPLFPSLLCVGVSVAVLVLPCGLKKPAGCGGLCGLQPAWQRALYGHPERVTAAAGVTAFARGVRQLVREGSWVPYTTF